MYVLNDFKLFFALPIKYNIFHFKPALFNKSDHFISQDIHIWAKKDMVQFWIFVFKNRLSSVTYLADSLLPWEFMSCPGNTKLGLNDTLFLLDLRMHFLFVRYTLKLCRALTANVKN